MIILVFHLHVIATRQGGGNQLFIDPYPDGLSNLKVTGVSTFQGDLQVDGTTTGRLTLQLRLLMTQDMKVGDGISA